MLRPGISGDEDFGSGKIKGKRFMWIFWVGESGY
jgi:hypothetical protein